MAVIGRAPMGEPRSPYDLPLVDLLRDTTPGVDPWSRSLIGTATTSATPQTVLTHDTYLDMMKKAMSLIPEEPFKRMMRELGFDPADGYVLYLPVCVEPHIPTNLPQYVRISLTACQPTIVLDPITTNATNFTWDDFQ